LYLNSSGLRSLDAAVQRLQNIYFKKRLITKYFKYGTDITIKILSKPVFEDELE
jgi:hypothetical protein